jgi:hypothetical protein
MLQRQQQLITQFHRVVDAGLCGVGFWLAHWMRDEDLFRVWDRPEIHSFGHYAWFLAIILPIAPLFLQLQGFYDRPVLATRRRTISQLSRGILWLSIGLILVSFVMRTQPARSIIVLFGPISFLLILLQGRTGAALGPQQFRTKSTPAPRHPRGHGRGRWESPAPTAGPHVVEPRDHRGDRFEHDADRTAWWSCCTIIRSMPFC